MSEHWTLIRHGEHAPAYNMAFDESMLLAANDLGQPIFRFYSWTEPAATFGYFQKYQEIENTTPLRPLIRRATGGGLVPHDHDWTYSVAFPSGHPWHRLKAEDSYQKIHQWVADALTAAGMPSELAPCCIHNGPGQCFLGAEKYDVLYKGLKIAGAAQRRNRNGLLIQGSVQPGPEPTIPREKWEEAILASPPDVLEWTQDESDTLHASTTELAKSKYNTDAYNRKR